MNIKLISIATSLTLVSLLSACGGGGSGGSDGSTADTGGTSSMITSGVVLNAGDINCPTGGASIDYGIDTNTNGILDAGEVNGTDYACNGENGLNSLFTMTTLATGNANCLNGGQMMEAGLDLDADGTLQVGEVTTTSYYCNQIYQPLTATTVSSTEIDLDWSAMPVTPNVMYYDIYANNQAVFYAPDASVTTHSVTGLQANTRYCFSVVGLDSTFSVVTESPESCATTNYLDGMLAAEGSITTPLDVSSQLPHSGSVNDRSNSYYMVTGLTVGTDYIISLTGLSGDADLRVFDNDSSFATAACSSLTNGTNNESCGVTASATTMYIMVENFTSPSTSYTLSLSINTNVNEGLVATPQAIALAAMPYSGTVLTGESYYAVTGLTIGTDYAVALTGLLENANLYVYDIDSTFTTSVCSSTNTSTSDDVCTVTASGTTMYIMVDGSLSGTGTSYNLDVGLNGDAGNGTVYTSTDIPVTIVDLSSVTSTLTVAGGTASITDINVTVDIIHTFDGDVTITLTSPTGTSVVLSANNGAAADNYTNTVFDDESGLLISNGAAPFTGSFRPDAALSGFDAEDANGVWTLTINDRAGGDTGTLNSWSIEIQ